MPPAKKTAAKKTSGGSGFTAEERAAMKERSRELRAQQSAEADAQAVVDKIAEMPEDDRVLAEHVHQVVTSAAPELLPKLWYGMPAYARDGKVVAYFKDAAKFKTRYAQFGFEDAAQLDDGAMWPTVFGLVRWTKDVEKQIEELVRRAAG